MYKIHGFRVFTPSRISLELQNGKDIGLSNLAQNHLGKKSPTFHDHS